MNSRPEIQVGTGNGVPVDNWRFLLVAAGQCRSAGGGAVVTRSLSLMLSFSPTSIISNNCIMQIYSFKYLKCQEYFLVKTIHTFSRSETISRHSRNPWSVCLSVRKQDIYPKFSTRSLHIR